MTAILTRELKLNALEEAEVRAQLADGKSLLDAQTNAARERLAWELKSDRWIDEEYQRHVLGNEFEPLDSLD